MGIHSGVVILVGVALLQWTAQVSGGSKGEDGRNGDVGLAGRDGLPGPKGDRGQPAQDTGGHLQKGEKGRRGEPGATGPKGSQGLPGEEGIPGVMGPPGGNVSPGGSTSQHQSAFSVVRALNTYPQNKQKVIFETVITNTPGDFSLSTGTFTCRIPGVYYFSFHASSKASLCLRLRSEVVQENTLGFCDFNGRETLQVMSGGAVLLLGRNDHVWLEGLTDPLPASVVGNTQEKKIIFNGFLLYAT